MEEEKGTLRVMAPCLERDEVKFMRHMGRKLKYMGTWEKTRKNSGNICYIGLLTKGTKKINIPSLFSLKEGIVEKIEILIYEIKGSRTT
jgi:hypothetical protein